MLDEDMQMLRDSAERLFTGADALRKLRSWRDGRDLMAAARGSWGSMVEAGFAGMLVSEQFGGAGLPHLASVHISELMGRTLATGPFLSSAVMAATSIQEGGNPRLQAELLPAITAGAVVAFAGEESARHDPDRIATVATRDDNGFRISGRKLTVIDGGIAEKFIVVARSAEASERLLLLAVNAGAAGVTVEARMGLDSRPIVDVVFDNAFAAGDLVCPPEKTASLRDAVYDVGRLHLAAEMLGAAQEAFDRTVDYLRTRVQFGRPIGEFQALQHRAALLFGQLEIARSTVFKAATALTGESASLAKAKAGDVAIHATTEAVQLHGGIGVTDEFDLGFFVKHVRTAAQLLGDSAFHVERYARFQGL